MFGVVVINHYHWQQRGLTELENSRVFKMRNKTTTRLLDVVNNV